MHQVSMTKRAARGQAGGGSKGGKGQQAQPTQDQEGHPVPPPNITVPRVPAGSATQYIEKSPEAGNRDICTNLLNEGRCDAHLRDLEKGVAEECPYHWHPTLTPGKKGICTWFQRAGSGCTNSAGCGFDHIAVGETAARLLLKSVTDRAARRGTSPGANRNHICKQFQQRGSCDRGDKCNFKH